MSPVFGSFHDFDNFDPDNEGRPVARRASPTPPTTEGRGGALIEWLTGLVNEGGDAPIEMPIRDMKILLALLSSPRVEDVRRMREALEKIAAAQPAMPHIERALLRREIALEALSPPSGDGKQEQARPSGSAPTTTGN